MVTNMRKLNQCVRVLIIFWIIMVCEENFAKAEPPATNPVTIGQRILENLKYDAASRGASKISKTVLNLGIAEKPAGIPFFINGVPLRLPPSRCIIKVNNNQFFDEMMSQRFMPIDLEWIQDGKEFVKSTAQWNAKVKNRLQRVQAIPTLEQLESRSSQLILSANESVTDFNDLTAIGKLSINLNSKSAVSEIGSSLNIYIGNRPLWRQWTTVTIPYEDKVIAPSAYSFFPWGELAAIRQVAIDAPQPSVKRLYDSWLNSIYAAIPEYDHVTVRKKLSAALERLDKLTALEFYKRACQFSTADMGKCDNLDEALENAVLGYIYEGSSSRICTWSLGKYDCVAIEQYHENNCIKVSIFDKQGNAIMVMTIWDFKLPDSPDPMLETLASFFGVVEVKDCKKN